LLILSQVTTFITTAIPWEDSYGALNIEGYLDTHKRQQLTG
jgi:hypothetical protein